MAKPAISIEIFRLDPGAPGTLQDRIQQMVAEGILQGRFRPGERLPSSRKLANHLGVSRITVTLAYTELVADDYLIAMGRSGYYISDNAPEPVAFPALASSASSVDWRARLVRPIPRPGMDKPQDWARYRYNFIYGQADPTLFDSGNWRLCALQALGKRDFDSLTADQFDQDDPLLIDFIVRQTLPRRGILAANDEVLLTMGAQNALWLIAALLLGPGRRAAVEDPGYPSLRSIIAAVGAESVPVAVDQDGLKIDDLPRADLVFVTPSHQCPTNVTMPAERREALLVRAEENDLVVVEDDYDFEMTYDAPTRPALKSLDTSGRVLYVGSFSKSIFPGLRLGYLVGPRAFIAEARALRAQMLRHPPGLLQKTTAYFLSLGHYHAQLRRTARAYQTRRAALLDAIARHGLTPAQTKTGGGSAIWMKAPLAIDTADLATQLREEGVLIEPGAQFFCGPSAPGYYYRLAYSSLPTDRIDDGVSRIATAMDVIDSY